MGLSMGFLTAVIGFTLLMKESYAEGKLPKPIIVLFTDDPHNVVMIGDTVRFQCTNSTNAQKFELIKNNITIMEQDSSTFIITNITRSNAGRYTCLYSLNSERSELSKGRFLNVKDEYLAPTLTVTPQRNSQPGETIHIKCQSPYAHMTYTLFKFGQILGKSAGNSYTYTISKAKQNDSGQYICRFQNEYNGMQSYYSNPVMINIEELPSPSVSLEVNANEQVKINCSAPSEVLVKHKSMWFQLLNSNNEVEKKTGEKNQDTVEFTLDTLKPGTNIYYCIYRVRIYYNYANSSNSEPIIILGGYSIWFIINCILAAALIIFGGLAVCYVKTKCEWIVIITQETQKEQRPRLPAVRKTNAAESEYSEMVIMQTVNEPGETLYSDPTSCVVSSDNVELEEQQIAIEGTVSF